MENKKNKSLIIRIAVLYFLLTSFMLVILLFIVSDNQIDIMTENAKYQARDLLHQISIRLKESTYGFSENTQKGQSRSKLIELVKPILQNIIPEFAICDEKGNVIEASLNAPFITANMKEYCQKALTINDFSGDEYILSADTQHERILFFYPLNIAALEPVVIYIPYNLSWVNSKFQRYYLSLILTILVVIAINIIITLVISSWIILPITKLRDSAREIAKGKYDIRVTVSGRDEIGELAYSFNIMSSEIERKVCQLNELVETVNNANQKLERLASIDELTGLYNRRQFYQLFHEELENFKRYNHYFSIIMMDIDYFKLVNDRFGHEAGDQVLQEISKLLLSAFRKGDKIARYGGEEFIMILPMTNIEQAALSAEKIRSGIENLKIKLADGNTIQVTSSFGISDVGMLEISTEEIYRERIITLADQALYQAKNDGRNKVVIYKPESPENKEKESS